MRYIFCFLLGGVLLSSCAGNDAGQSTGNPKYDSTAQAAAKDSANYTTIQWLDPVVQDLGKINEGASVDLMWHFKNSGNKPLFVESARGSCGCTVVDSPKEPIAPGKEGIIKARFNSEGKQGPQHKDVYVVANNSNPNGDRENDLKFTVEVLKK